MVNGDRVVGGRQWRRTAGADPGFKGSFDEARNRAESDFAADEGRDRNLIRSIVYRGRSTSGPQRVESEAEPREAVEIRRFESELPDLGQIEPGRGPDDAIGPSKAMRDRRAHVRRAEL